ncbi:MAG: acetyl-coenzyme A synthetase N-terminal domain-containing protein, partial [Gammaproteobacteria bacterium]|nr:acetyl-coenzyme A synthetase N-terminal domain-containing protein [Gammaproteobacteria bacterium]
MNDKSIESLLHEQRKFPPSDEFISAARLQPSAAEALYAEAAADHEAFWGRLAQQEIHWETPFTDILDA